MLPCPGVARPTSADLTSHGVRSHACGHRSTETSPTPALCIHLSASLLMDITLPSCDLPHPCACWARIVRGRRSQPSCAASQHQLHSTQRCPSTGALHPHSTPHRHLLVAILLLSVKQGAFGGIRPSVAKSTRRATPAFDPSSPFSRRATPAFDPASPFACGNTPPECEAGGFRTVPASPTRPGALHPHLS
jgi:hypothetical protein